MARYVTLPAIDKRVPLGAYIKAIKTAKANPTAEFKTGLTTWWPTTGAEIMEQFMAGVTDRINQGVPYNKRGVM
jgi:hypothetical protein